MWSVGNPILKADTQKETESPPNNDNRVPQNFEMAEAEQEEEESTGSETSAESIVQPATPPQTEPTTNTNNTSVPAPVLTTDLFWQLVDRIDWRDGFHNQPAQERMNQMNKATLDQCILFTKQFIQELRSGPFKEFETQAAIRDDSLASHVVGRGMNYYYNIIAEPPFLYGLTLESNQRDFLAALETARAKKN